jgi:hypothetical protein
MTFEARFKALADAWRHGSLGPSSDLAHLLIHPAYLAIIAMGPDVVPLIMEEMRERPDHWHRALAALTDVDPVPREAAGDVVAIADAWLAWYAGGYVGEGQAWQKIHLPYSRVQSEKLVPIPIPMILTCPIRECGARHIDTGEFATKVHHTHSCQKCGTTWRPAVVPTVGVQFLPGFKSDP